MTSTKIMGWILGFALVCGLGVAVERLKSPEDVTGSVLRQNPGAITKAGESRREALVARLAAAPHTLRELPDGYSLTYFDGPSLLPTATEWMALETRVDPFLDVSVAVLRNRGALVIRVAGAQGVKPFLAREWGPLLNKTPLR